MKISNVFKGFFSVIFWLVLIVGGIFGYFYYQYHQENSIFYQDFDIEITSEQGSTMAAMLATGGICPRTGKQYFDTETVRDCVSLMFSCGMYDFSG